MAKRTKTPKTETTADVAETNGKADKYSRDFVAPDVTAFVKAYRGNNGDNEATAKEFGLTAFQVRLFRDRLIKKGVNLPKQKHTASVKLTTEEVAALNAI